MKEGDIVQDNSLGGIIGTVQEVVGRSVTVQYEHTRVTYTGEIYGLERFGASPLADILGGMPFLN